MPRPFLAAFALLSLVACSDPAQYGGPIPVNTAGVAARVRLLCRFDEAQRCLEQTGASGDDRVAARVRAADAASQGRDAPRRR